MIHELPFMFSLGVLSGNMLSLIVHTTDCSTVQDMHATLASAAQSADAAAAVAVQKQLSRQACLDDNTA